MSAASARLAVALLCLVGLVGLSVHYGATEADQTPYPTAEQLDGEYDDSDGERVLVFGEVRAIDRAGDEMTIEVGSDEPETGLVLVVTEALDDVQTGGVVQVYGELRPGQSMAADEVVVVNSDPGDERYKLGASVVGLGVAAGYFLRHWRLSLSPLGWGVRSDG